jgi:hypothetical protein
MRTIFLNLLLEWNCQSGLDCPSGRIPPSNKGEVLLPNVHLGVEQGFCFAQVPFQVCIERDHQPRAFREKAATEQLIAIPSPEVFETSLHKPMIRRKPE